MLLYKRCEIFCQGYAYKKTRFLLALLTLIQLYHKTNTRGKGRSEAINNWPLTTHSRVSNLVVSHMHLVLYVSWSCWQRGTLNNNTYANCVRHEIQHLYYIIKQ